jgi:hypothetical protein
MGKKKKAAEGSPREDAALDRILEATNALLAAQGTDESGRYLKRIEACANDLELVVNALPE